MRPDYATLLTLAEEIGRFYVTDRAMKRAQERFTGMLANGEPAPAEIEAYLRAVRRYFTGFEREARAHLADVEKRLAAVSQRQFNLTAERGVAARRVAATQGVLTRVTEIERA